MTQWWRFEVRSSGTKAKTARKLRAVVDTNVFISGLFGKGTLAAELQDLWINQEFELVTSLEILREVSRVLHYPRIQQRFQPREETIRRFFHLVFRVLS
jgi:putative PIN family toxin of toxin-antitoxin system